MRTRAILVGHDAEVLAWVAARLPTDFLRVLAAIGVLDGEPGAMELVGGVVLHNWSKYDIEMSMCFTCYRTEWDWRVCYEGDYTCANCKDLTRFDRQRKAFIKMHHHLTGVLPHPLSLSSLFEHLYPIS